MLPCRKGISTGGTGTHAPASLHPLLYTQMEDKDMASLSLGSEGRGIPPPSRKIGYHFPSIHALYLLLSHGRGLHGRTFTLKHHAPLLHPSKSSWTGLKRKKALREAGVRTIQLQKVHFPPLHRTFKLLSLLTTTTHTACIAETSHLSPLCLAFW